MALELTQPLTEKSNRNILWEVKAVGAYGWRPYHFHVPNVFKSDSLNLLEPSGLSRLVMELIYAYVNQDPVFWFLVCVDKRCSFCAANINEDNRYGDVKYKICKFLNKFLHATPVPHPSVILIVFVCTPNIV